MTNQTFKPNSSKVLFSSIVIDDVTYYINDKNDDDDTHNHIKNIPKKNSLIVFGDIIVINDNFKFLWLPTTDDYDSTYTLWYMNGDKYEYPWGILYDILGSDYKEFRKQLIQTRPKRKLINKYYDNVILHNNIVDIDIINNMISCDISDIKVLDKNRNIINVIYENKDDISKRDINIIMKELNNNHIIYIHNSIKFIDEYLEKFNDHIMCSTINYCYEFYN